MHTLAPLLTALLSLAMAIAVLARNRRDRVHQEYAYLASVIAIAFLCLFFLGLAENAVLGAERTWIWQYGVMFAGLLVAPASAQVYHRVLKRYNPRTGGVVPGLYFVAAVQALLCVLTPPSSVMFAWAAVLTGAVIFLGLVVGVVLLVRISRAIPEPEERARLRYLTWSSGIAVAANAAEMFGHVYNSFNSDVPDLAFPPVGSLTASVYVYFLGQVILAYRLLDLHEIIVELGVFLLAAGSLAGIYGVLLVGVGAVGGGHTSATLVNTFLASVVLLILYDPVRTLFERQLRDRFFVDRFEVRRAVERLQRRMTGLIELGPLVRAILGALGDCRRTDLASIYLWDDAQRGYVPTVASPRLDVPPLAAVPQLPFSEVLVEGREGCSLDAARRLSALGPADQRGRWEVVARTMEGMQSDLTLPFVVGHNVLGWLNVRDSRAPPGSGYSRDEVEALRGVVAQAGVLVDNTRQFERMKERERLAALGEMSAGLAHEIRNPLGAIKGAAQYLQAGPVPEDEREFLGIIVEEADRLNRVVTQFLDYARPLAVEVTPAALADVVRGVIQLVQTHGLPQGVEIGLAVEQDLPPIPVDVEKVKQVALNLVQNAVEAMPSGGTVRIAVRRAGGPVDAEDGGGPWMRRRTGAITGDRSAQEMVVGDDGPGISAEDLDRLFIPFFTTKVRGTGLGLPLCERVVRSHGGEIEVRTRPGRGARFVVRFPAAA
ncbi:ATP-binding protein [Myxococcota bacterium]|nr:ATP-binding protein [Myxococcota bacterium]